MEWLLTIAGAAMVAGLMLMAYGCIGLKRQLEDDEREHREWLEGRNPKSKPSEPEA